MALNPLAMWQVVVAGIAVHFILFYSIFDIYFTSPLVHGMTPQSAPTKPLAKRLVLFVADGLRADKFFELDKNGQSRAPYLRSVIETHGAWGVSHTRMPTESRPGHVAMIAGFYEDVSAVAKGWKENPVEFDSVFNETRHTWSWGSPDILPMFAKGAKRGHVNMDCYPGEEEDFASTMSSNLDTWVFDRFKTFLSSAQDNRTLNDMLNEDRIVMFLHLLGIDVNGHSHKPHSQEYLENIRIVDQGIYQVVKLMDDFYQDSKTAYVMTSDHGMTNWGSHGAGDPHETLTPLVVWGSGIRGAQRHHHLSDHPFEDASRDWNLQHVKRVDIEQADIAPLMACLIGITFPLNSVGTLPLDYLDATDSYKADNLLTNAYQILSQFQIKMEEKRETSLSYFFRPYTPLTASKQAGYLREIRHLMQTKEYSQAIDQTNHLIKLALRGLTYYHTYDRFLLGVSIALSFLGWITYTLCFVLSRYSSFTTARTKSDRLGTPAWRADSTIKIAFGTLCSVVVFIMYVQRSPVTHVVYVVLPVVLWGLVSLSFSPVSQVMSHIYKSGQAINTLFIIGPFLCGLELLVQSFFHRWCLSLGLVSMAFIIGFSNTHRLDKTTLFCWIGGCLILAVFPLLPVVGGQTNHNLVVFSGGVICVGGVLILFRTKAHKSARLVHFIQIVAVALTSYIVKSTSLSIADKSGVPWLNQITSWVILATSLVIPLFSSTGVVERLFSLTMSLCAPYLLLSMAHEGLFLISLCFVLFLWLSIEHSLTDSPNRITDLVFTSEHHPSNERNHVTVSDLKISYFIVSFTPFSLQARSHLPRQALPIQLIITGCAPVDSHRLFWYRQHRQHQQLRPHVSLLFPYGLLSLYHGGTDDVEECDPVPAGHLHLPCRARLHPSPHHRLLLPRPHHVRPHGIQLLFPDPRHGQLARHRHEHQPLRDRHDDDPLLHAAARRHVRGHAPLPAPPAPVQAARVLRGIAGRVRFTSSSQADHYSLTQVFGDLSYTLFGVRFAYSNSI